MTAESARINAAVKAGEDIRYKGSLTPFHGWAVVAALQSGCADCPPDRLTLELVAPAWRLTHETRRVPAGQWAELDHVSPASIEFAAVVA